MTAVAALRAPDGDPETRKRAAIEFGRLFGWQTTHHPFSLWRIAAWCDGRDPAIYNRRLVDHPTYYRRGHRPIALAAQVYDWPLIAPDCRAFADWLGVALILPDVESYPPRTKLIVYARCFEVVA